MIYMTASDLKMIKESSAIIWKNLESFTGEDRERLEAFCRYAVTVEQRYQDGKEKHRKAMKEYRTDPKTAETARKHTREASKRFREKRKKA